MNINIIILIIMLSVLVILVVAIVFFTIKDNYDNHIIVKKEHLKTNYVINKQDEIKKYYDNPDRGVLLTMIRVPLVNSEGKTPIPDIEAITLENCTKLGYISKPENGIINFTLLNKKLPFDFYKPTKYISNIGVILNPDYILPKNNYSKYVQCMGVRDRGSDSRRCDSDFKQKLNNKKDKHTTTGKYTYPLRSIAKSCDCTYIDGISNACNTKPQIAGCGAKCSTSGQICGDISWCRKHDAKNDPDENGGFCAWHPEDMSSFIEATIEWNKANINNNWNTPHPENEINAIIEDTQENQQVIYDAILAFIITDSCSVCSPSVMAQFINKMKFIVGEFNRDFNKNAKLYLVHDTEYLKNNGTVINSEWISWENNNYQSDLFAFMTEINVPTLGRPKTKKMYTYRAASSVDGITNHNTGDIPGDNSYIGGEFCGRHPDCETSLFTRYEVEYDESRVPNQATQTDDGSMCNSKTPKTTKCTPIHNGFGNYALCNPGGKVGGTGPYKCTACSDKSLEGSCSFSPGVQNDRFSGGKWYSWPDSSQCSDNQEIGDNDCKWKIHGNPKSVTVKDLINNGYKILPTDTYTKYSTDCAKDPTTKSKCLTDKVSDFVKENKENNVKIMKNIFN